MAKKRLGIDALFQTAVPAAVPSAPAEATSDVVSIETGRLRPGRKQPRAHFDEAALRDLTASVREHGVLQPILARPADERDAYEIVAGERRWRAAKAAGLTAVPVRVLDLSDASTVAVAMVENLQRENLNALEEAEGYLELLRIRLADEPAFSVLPDEDERTAVLRVLRALNNRAAGNSKDNVVLRLEPAVVEVFSKVGRLSWQSFVAHRLPLLGLPDDVRAAVQSGGLPYTKARLIARITAQRLAGDHNRARRVRRDLIEQAVTEGLSVRGLQAAIADILDSDPPMPSPRASQARQPDATRLDTAVAALRERLATVDIESVDPRDHDALCAALEHALELLPD